MKPGSIIEDRFEVLEHHADGGMGVVYRGRDTKSGQPVAIKVVTVPTDVDEGRFEREVELLATLTHEGIVRYVSHGVTHADQRYLIQEWVDGDTLHSKLVNAGVDQREALQLTRQIALALAEAHQLGIVHRDIKPSNVIVEDDGRIRVLDFGLARLGEASDRVTRTGTAVGTPGYMAPEQIIGTQTITPRVDVFAMGCVLYRTLSGHHPFAGRDPAAVRTKVLMCEPPALDRLCDDISTPLAALVSSMLEKDPDKRPADAAEVAERLSRLIPDAGGGRRVFAAAASAEPTLALPTAVIAGEHTAIVMLRDLSRDEHVVGDAEIERMRGSLTAATEAFRGRLQVLDAANVVFRVDGDQAACASRAVRAALVLASLVPEAGVAAAIGAASDLGAVVESASRMAEGIGLKHLFAGGGDGSIHVSGELASVLPARFDSQVDGDAHVIRPSRAERVVE